MIKFFGLHHRFFRPLIRRILTLLAIAIYGVVEMFYGHEGWAAFALGLCAVCAYAFFIKPDPDNPDP